MSISTLGIIGSGQLGSLLCQAAKKLDVKTVVISDDKDGPAQNYSDEFIHYFITPMGAAIWSTPANKVLDMPAYFFIKFFYNHGMLEIVNRPKWWVIKNGSSQYIKKIIKGFENKIHLSSAVVKVSRSKEGVEIFLSNHNETLKFDAVIFATHSDQALKLLDRPTE